MSNSLLAEKLEQASSLVADSPFDVWITFVRETAESGDPILPYLIEGSLTWQSALLVGRNGRRVAIVGQYDQDPLVKSGNWHEVRTYVQDIKPALLAELEEMGSVPEPRIAANFSMNDEKCDGLSHGMQLLLEGYLAGTRFSGRLESSESVCMALRGRKSADEVRRMKAAIAAGDEVFAEIGSFAKVGVSEKAVFDHVHAMVDSRGWGYSWDPHQDPIVNSGPNSALGHGTPNPAITLEPGHVFHVDLGVIVEGYASDVQRVWYVRGSEGDEIPDDVARGFNAVRGAILAGFAALRPGVQGWEVDAAGRSFLLAAGYEDFQHAFGHQVGRVAHDGGAILGPKWARYGDRPSVPIAEGECYTLELGVVLPGRGYLGLEEMVQVTTSGCVWMTLPQESIWVI